jgi:uracil-DNA glycosylase
LPNAFPHLEKVVSSCQRCFKPIARVETLGDGNPHGAVLIAAPYAFSPSGATLEERVFGKERVQYYYKLLSLLGLKQEIVWLTTCAKCMCNGQHGQVMLCKEILDQEISMVNPRLIITIGESAFHVIGGSVDWVPGKSVTKDKRQIIPMIGFNVFSNNVQFELYFLRVARAIRNIMEQPNLDFYQ